MMKINDTSAVRFRPNLPARILAALLMAFVLHAGHAYAEEISIKVEDPNAKMKYDRGSAGVLVSLTIVGIQGEYRVIPALGLKVIGLYIIGANFNDLKTDEYILSGLLVPVYHLVPDSKLFDPVLMCGIVYSFHHWVTKANDFIAINMNRSVKRGNFHDITGGFGFGVNFKFARFTFGLDLWLNIDYQVKLTYSLKKRKGERIILPLVLFEFAGNF